MKRTIRKFSLSFIVPAMTLAVLLTACGDDGSSGVDSVPVEPGESSSSSVVSGATPDVTPDSVPGSNSSTSEEGVSSSSVSSGTVPGSNSSTSEVKPDGYYSNSSNCPAGLTCKYATTTEYLNPDKTYGEFLDTRDGQVYKTIEICDKNDENCQTWMAQNLNYAYTGVKFNYGGHTSDSTSWCYDNEVSNCEKYGRLYTWAAVMDSAAQFSVNAGTECGYDKICTPNSPHRGICPEGWHVPTDEEYSTLYTNIGSPSTAGSLLKSTSGWSGGGNGSDKYGFSALPAGFRHYDGIFDDEGGYTTLWSASENNGSYACFQYFYYPNGYASQYYNEKFLGMSLRCLKDSI